MNLCENMYLLGRKLYKRNIPVLPHIIYVLIRFLFSCDLPLSVKIKGNMIISH